MFQLFNAGMNGSETPFSLTNVLLLRLFWRGEKNA
jgi:hypothetical protein